MDEQGGCIAIVSSEGGMVDIISGLYSKNVNIDIYLKGYSGDSLKVDRIGRDSLYIPNPKLTILLTVQPNHFVAIRLMVTRKIQTIRIIGS